MTWAKLDDDFPQHPKVIGLSDQAFRLHVSSVCYANRNLTDGKIAPAVLTTLLPAAGKAGCRRRAVELVDAVLWEVADCGCFLIHDFLKYNQSREEVLAKRERNAKHGAKGGASRSLRILPNPEPTPVPEPIPVQIHRDDASSSGARSAGDWYLALNHRVPPNAVSKQVVEDMDIHGEACLDWAFKQSADKEDPWRYGLGILKHCAAEGHGPRGGKNGPDIGTSQGRRDLRQDHGRHLGASQRVPGAGVDWDREEREQARLIAGAKSHAEGLPAGEMEDVV